jgi:hypothetical protein
MGMEVHKFSYTVPFKLNVAEKMQQFLMENFVEFESETSAPVIKGWTLKVNHPNSEEPLNQIQMLPETSIYGLIAYKGAHEVFIVNIDKDAFIGEWKPTLAAKNKESLDEFKKDFGFLGRIAENAKIGVWL